MDPRRRRLVGCNLFQLHIDLNQKFRLGSRNTSC
jgi:hypothetical protein